MGYSTKQIDVPQALELVEEKQVMSASKANYFDDTHWQKEIVKAEISDHWTPRIYFTLANGDFVEME